MTFILQWRPSLDVTADRELFDMRTRARSILFALAAASLAMTGCGGGGSGSPASSGPTPPPPPVNTHVYVLNAGQSTVSAYVLDSGSGALTAIQGSPFAVPNGGYSMAVQRKTRTLFFGSTVANSVSAMSIDSATGKLTAAGDPFFTVVGPISTAIDPGGTYLYTANSGDGTVSALKVNGTTLTQVAGSPFPVGSTPYAVAVSPDSKFVFVANRDDGTISVLSADATTGALAPVAGSPFAMNGAFNLPVALAVNPAGTFLYVATAQDISAYAVDPATGALSQIAGGAGTGGGTNSIAVDPAGKYLYLAAMFSVYGFSIDSQTGGLQSLASGPYTNTARSLQLAFDPSGKFLFVTDNSQNAVASYVVNAADGTLSPAPGSPFPLDPTSAMGQGPTQVLAVN